jgi:hypothetical protein
MKDLQSAPTWDCIPEADPTTPKKPVYPTLGQVLACTAFYQEEHVEVRVCDGKDVFSTKDKKPSARIKSAPGVTTVTDFLDHYLDNRVRSMAIHSDSPSENRFFERKKDPHIMICLCNSTVD